MALKLSSRTVEGIQVLDCEGRVVFGDECFALRDTVKRMLEKSPNLVLNLGDVSYIDSGGLGTLVGLYTSARNANGNIKLASLNHRVIDLLQVTKLLTVFETFPNVNEAVKSFATATSAA
jgi:anti-sigma B factor antagonist